MTDSHTPPDTDGDDFERRSQRVAPPPSAIEAHRILQSATSMTLTAANRLGIRRMLALTAEHPVTITERGEPVGHLYSAEHWDTVFSATTELTSTSLRALSEILTRLKPDELMAIVTPLLDVLEFTPESRP